MQDLQHLVDLRFQVGEVASIDKLSELWAIDKTAYGEASLSWETFKGWWRSYRPGLKALFLEDRIVGAIGIWPLSERCARRLAAGRIKESDRQAALKDFNRSASAPFQRISESLRFLGSDFGLSGQFPERRAAVFNLHMPDHRQIICRRIAEFCKQPLGAGRLGE
jgi:hypothetical protein